jgi:methionine-rich copper-binding protein CopC
MKKATRQFISLLFAGIALPITALAVQAHAALESSYPAPDSILTSVPTHVALIFEEHLSKVAGANVLRVQNGSGDEVSEGSTLVEGGKIERGLLRSLNPGTYTVLYRVLSQDGHVVSGSYNFQISEELNLKAQSSVVDVPPASLNDSSKNIDSKKDHGNPVESHQSSSIVIWSLIAGTLGILWFVFEIVRRRNDLGLNRRP